MAEVLLEIVLPYKVDKPIKAALVVNALKGRGYPKATARKVRELAAWLRTKTNPVPILTKPGRPGGYYYPRKAADFLPYLGDSAGRLRHIGRQLKKMQLLYELMDGPQKDLFA